MRGDDLKSVFGFDRKTVESFPHSDPRRQLVDDIFDRFCSFLSLHHFLLPGDVVSFTSVDLVDDSSGKNVFFSFHVNLR